MSRHILAGDDAAADGGEIIEHLPPLVRHLLALQPKYQAVNEMHIMGAWTGPPWVGEGYKGTDEGV